MLCHDIISRKDFSDEKGEVTFTQQWNETWQGDTVGIRNNVQDGTSITVRNFLYKRL